MHVNTIVSALGLIYNCYNSTYGIVLSWNLKYSYLRVHVLFLGGWGGGVASDVPLSDRAVWDAPTPKERARMHERTLAFTS